MSRMEQRYAAIRGCGIVFALFACAFTWLAVLSFDPVDWPSPHVFPHPSPANNAAGRAGGWVAFHLFELFGKGAYAAVMGLTLALAVLARQGRLPSIWQRLIGIGLLITVVSAAGHILGGTGAQAWPEERGGVLGYLIATRLDQSVKWMKYPILLYGLIVGLLCSPHDLRTRGPARGRARQHHITGATTPAGGFLAGLPGLIGRLIAAYGKGPQPAGAMAAAGRVSTPEPRRRSAVTPAGQEAAAPGDSATALIDEDEQEGDAAPVYRGGRDEFDDDDDDEDDDDWVVDENPPDDGVEIDPELLAAQKAEAAAAVAAKLVVNCATTRKVTTDPVVPPKPYPSELANWEFPPANLLLESTYSFTAQQETVVREQARVLDQTLKEFGVDAHVVEISTGPVITMFELHVAPGVKVNHITSLDNDIARALKVLCIRVVSPIPGKDTVGIEVPNSSKEIVRLRELMGLSQSALGKMTLPLFLGKDASGSALVGDLSRMPHLLIGGTTGSGKSVCINSIILSLLMTQRPDMVKLILVDPKVVEMSAFRDVPHLMCPIVTDMARAEKILEWATVKMDERYDLFAEAGVRDISGFNKLPREDKYARFHAETDEEKAQVQLHVPYIVIIIDELADLMMTSGKEVEKHLVRLAQKSRAVGIHIVLATQRPEAKVITGMITGNIYCRIAFKVASRVNSRIILDGNGAEVLMGQGDMLYRPPNSADLVRAQGTYLDEPEIRGVIDYLRERGAPEFHPELVKLGQAEVDGDGPQDDLFEQAVDYIVATGRGSVSLLQRRLTIGYARASRLIECMAAMGIVGEFKNSQAREVMLTAEQWGAMKAERAEKAEAELQKQRDTVFNDGVPEDMFDDDID